MSSFRDFPQAWSFYRILCLILWPYTCPLYFRQTCIVLKLGWRSTTGPPDLWSSSPVPGSPPDATAKPMASSHHFTLLCQVLTRMAPLVWSSAAFLLPRWTEPPSLLSRLITIVGNIKFVLIWIRTLNRQLYFRTHWVRSQRRSQFKHDYCRGADRAPQINHGYLQARQATGSQAHIVGEALTGPNRCPNGLESAVRVQAWGKPLNGTKLCARCLRSLFRFFIIAWLFCFTIYSSSIILLVAP